MPRIRRLPAHGFVQHTTDPAYQWCTYPDPDNVMSGICGMGPMWHVRDAEERAAEAEEEAAISNPVHPDSGPPAVIDAPASRRWAMQDCQVHGERAHDIADMQVRTYTIEVEGPQRQGRVYLKKIQLTVCDQVAMQLELLPLP